MWAKKYDGSVNSSILQIDMLTGEFVEQVKLTDVRVTAEYILGGSLWYITNDGSIWKTNVEAVGATLVVDHGLLNPDRDEFQVFQRGSGYFITARDIGTSAVFISDGTAANTSRLPQKLFTGARYSFDAGGNYLPQSVQSIGNDIYFLADTADFALEPMLYRLGEHSDVPELIHTYKPGFVIGELGRLGDNLLFDDVDVDGYVYLTAIDGATKTKQIVFDQALSGADFANYKFLGMNEGKAYFGSTTTAYLPGWTPSIVWVTDGTAAGTQQLDETEIEAAVAMFAPAIRYAGYEYSVNGSVVTRKTANGTLETLTFAGAGQSPTIEAISEVGGLLYFNLRITLDGGIARSYVTDGSDLAPKLVPMPDARGLLDPFTAGGNVYFWSTTWNVNTQSTLWKYDPSTNVATNIVQLVDDLLMVSASGVLGNTIYFATHNQTAGVTEVWKTDGTQVGTTKFATLTADSQPAEISFHQGIDNKLLVHVADHESGDSLWTIDAITSGVTRIYNAKTGIKWQGFHAADGRIFGTGFNPAVGEEFFVTDGTVEGTVNLGDFVKGSGGVNSNGGIGKQSVPAAPLVLPDGIMLVIGSRPERSNGTGIGTGTALWKIDTKLVGRVLVDSHFQVDENSGAGTYVGQLKFVHDESFEYQSFSMAAGSLPFAIDTTSGVIRVTDSAALNFETHDTWEFQVVMRYREKAGSAVLEKHVPVKIQLLDKNEKPRFISINNQIVTKFVSIDVNEDVAIHTPIGRITAGDEDAGQSLTFSEPLGHGSAVVRISPDGFLFLNTNDLNYEHHQSFTFFAAATDSGYPTKSQEFAIRFDVLNVDEPPQYFGDVEDRLAIVAGALTKQTALSRIPVDPEGGIATLTATMSDGKPLPKWIAYSASNNEFTITAPSSAVGVHAILLTATDQNGNHSSINIPLSVVANPSIAQNLSEASDVDSNGKVSVLDALLVLNFVARKGVGEEPAALPQRFYDVSGDAEVTVVDALIVLNEMSRRKRLLNSASEAAKGLIPVSAMVDSAMVAWPDLPSDWRKSNSKR